MAGGRALAPAMSASLEGAPNDMHLKHQLRGHVVFQLQGPYGFPAAASGGLYKFAALSNMAVSFQQENVTCMHNPTLPSWTSSWSPERQGQMNVVPGSLVHQQDVACAECLWPCCDHQDGCQQTWTSLCLLAVQPSICWLNLQLQSHNSDP